MSNTRRAGTVFVKVDARQYDAKGNFTYNLGLEKKTAIVGADRTHGYSAMPQVAFVEGAITDANDLDVAAMMAVEDATVTLELANGKVILLRNAWYASEGNITTEQGEIAVRWEGMSAEELA